MFIHLLSFGGTDVRKKSLRKGKIERKKLGDESRSLQLVGRGWGRAREEFVERESRMEEKRGI